MFLRAVPACTIASRSALCVSLAAMLPVLPAGAAEIVYLTEVPDYAWYYGCFGTASGNLMGYWDRHGLPDLYTGPTNDGVAPLNSFGPNNSIRAMWASEAGVDGRPNNLPGHVDDYYVAYESVAPDPYIAAGRPEHEPDCIGDFIGLNQDKWPDLGGECAGNIDAYSFNFFDPEGDRRENFIPTGPQGEPIPDIQSGLVAWTEFRGYRADSFSQLTDFNPNVPAGRGFTFEDLKAEIDAGYPVLLFMQPFNEFSRTVRGKPNQNPLIHAMLAYGYVVDDSGEKFVRYRTSWASGDNQFSAWTAGNWTPNGELNLPLRGVIGFHPHPKLVEVVPTDAGLRLRWHGPLSILHDDVQGTEEPVHQYVIEKTTSLAAPEWEPVAGPVSALEVNLPDCCEGTVFFRVRLMKRGSED